MLGTGAVKLSVAVMAHPTREAFVDELMPSLPGAQVVWDEKNDRWDTGRRSMLAYDPTADWHLVVQDDALLCRDFLPGVEAALEHVPSNPVAFYAGRVRPHAARVVKLIRNARATGNPWVVMPGPWWGVAVAVRTEQIDAMVAWGDEHPEIPNYDRRMAEHFERDDVACYYSVPSLVNHRVGPDNPSLVPGRSGAQGRVAYYFAAGESPLDVDWSRPPLVERQRAWWRHVRTGVIRKTTQGDSRSRQLARSKEWERVRRGECSSCGQRTYEPIEEAVPGCE